MEILIANVADPMISVPTFLGIIASIGVTLVGTVTALWKVIHTSMKTTEERLTGKLDECESKHEEANRQIIDLTEKVGRVEGIVEGFNMARSEIRGLSEAVLERLNSDDRNGD